MQDLPPRSMRAVAESTRIVLDESYEDDDGWTYTVSRLEATGVQTHVPLEGWWSHPDDPEPTIGRVRIKRPTPNLRPGDATNLGELAGLVDDPAGPHELVEILNVEIEPAFVGQGLGTDLIRAALADVPPGHLVACQPTPTEFGNIDVDVSRAAVHAYYRHLGFRPDDRAPDFLTAIRADLNL